MITIDDFDCHLQLLLAVVLDIACTLYYNQVDYFIHCPDTYFHHIYNKYFLLFPEEFYIVDILRHWTCVEAFETTN